MNIHCNAGISTTNLIADLPGFGEVWYGPEADLMFVNKIAFFMSISRNIKFGTGEKIENRKSKSLMIGIKSIKSLYMKRGFQLHTLIMDNGLNTFRVI
jgi:hypothetical protein